MKLTLTNVVLFHIGWFASVLGAANGLPWIGVAVVSGLLLAHLAIMRFRRGEALLLGGALLIGWSFDSAIVLMGGLAFPASAQLGGPTTLWMAFMWPNFATTLHTSLRWLQGRWALATIFGLIGGPASYFTGMKLGAVALPEPLWMSLLMIAIEWAIASPLLVWLALRCDGLTVRSSRGDAAGVAAGRLPS